MRELTWAKSDSKLRFMITTNVTLAEADGQSANRSDTIITLETPLACHAKNVASDRQFNNEHTGKLFRVTSIVYAQMVTPEQLDICGFNEAGELEAEHDGAVK